MPHGKCRKGKEPRKQPGHTFKPLKHARARDHQKDLADSLGKAPGETTHIDGKNAITHRGDHPVTQLVESA